MPCDNVRLGSYMKWKVGNDLRTILLDNTTLTGKVGTNIYPLIAPENVKGDFILYERVAYSKKWCKQGVWQDECKVAFSIVSDNYDDAIAIAQEVDKSLTGSQIIDDKKLFINLTDSTESFEDNKYIEVLVFTIE